MRWIRYSSAGRMAYGILEDERVLEVAGDPFLGYVRTARTHALADVRLNPPVIPPTFYSVGFNYATHIKAAAKMLDIPADLPTQPDVGYRAVNALIAHGESVVIPRDARNIQYEGELVAVIGRRVRNVTESEALACVLGYTIGNDVTERNWLKDDRTLWRAKNSDTFKPMGPWIETEVDLDSLTTHVRVNGREMTRFQTNDMVFGVASFISTISRYVTLYPGDIIWMGTDGTSPTLRAGDVVEVEISGLGILRNPFVAQAAAV